MTHREPTTRSGRRRRLDVVLWLGLASLISSCSLLSGPTVTYRSNRHVLEATAEAASFHVDAGRFTLTQAEILEDTVTFFYRGTEFATDRAWVLRFSPKSSEQDPIALTDVYRLLPILEDGREEFQITSEGSESHGSTTLRHVEYTFRSPVMGDDGEYPRGLGIVATLEVKDGDGPIVYHFNLDNWGDRETLGVAALEPFRKAALE